MNYLFDVVPQWHYGARLFDHQFIRTLQGTEWIVIVGKWSPEENVYMPIPHTFGTRAEAAQFMYLEQDIICWGCDGSGTDGTLTDAEMYMHGPFDTICGACNGKGMLPKKTNMMGRVTPDTILLRG